MMTLMKKPVRPRIVIDCDELDAVAVALMKLHTGKTPRDAFMKIIKDALKPYYAEAQKIIDRREKPA